MQNSRRMENSIIDGQLDILPSPCCFSKNASFKHVVKHFFFFLIIISHIFSENFIEISPIVQIIRRFSPSILTIFIDFFGFFDNLLLQRNSSCQHITDDVTIFFLFQSTLSRLLGVWEAGGCSNWPIPEKTTLRKPSLFRVKSFFDSQGIFFW